MRSTIRRAERCRQILSERYSDFLASLTEEQFADECRRLFAGYTRSQFSEEMGDVGSPVEDGHGGFSAYLDKLFEGRDRL